MVDIWNVAIYARVSTDKKEQQESIPAQVSSLKNWLLGKSKLDSKSVYNFIQVYEDTGFSGSNFDRDSFIRMKEDIEQGKINMVLTRDLSRFARNYVVAGYYLEEYFKVKGVRFISVLDNVDTLEEANNDIVPFKNILNEMYIKDCSRKTRDALKQRMLRGSSIASKPAYGYKFEEIYDGNVKTIKLVPAEDETTETVKEIYLLYLNGWGIDRIANYLNEKEIPTPSEHIENFGVSKYKLWSGSTIRSILTNPKYKGDMVQGRYKKISYKSKKIVTNLEDEWIHGEEFKGIIDKDMFDEVQEMLKNKKSNFRYKANDIHLFSGVLKCGDCTGGMCYRKKYKGYKCTNSQRGGKRCTAHAIKEEDLIEIVITDLKRYIDNNINREKIYRNAIKCVENKDKNEKQIKKYKNELKKLDRNLKRLYSDRLNGMINDRNYKMLLADIEKSQEELQQRIEEVQKKLNDDITGEIFYKRLKKSIDGILDLNNFDRTIVEALIDKIIIREDAATKEKNIDIYYKFKV